MGATLAQGSVVKSCRELNGTGRGVQLCGHCKEENGGAACLQLFRNEKNRSCFDLGCKTGENWCKVCANALTLSTGEEEGESGGGGSGCGGDGGKKSQTSSPARKKQRRNVTHDNRDTSNEVKTSEADQVFYKEIGNGMGDKLGMWQCPSPRCDAENYRDRIKCFKCKTRKPCFVKKKNFDSSLQSNISRDESWICKCKFWNMKNNASCWREGCSTPKGKWDDIRGFNQL